MNSATARLLQEFDEKYWTNGKDDTENQKRYYSALQMSAAKMVGHKTGDRELIMETKEGPDFTGGRRVA